MKKLFSFISGFALAAILGSTVSAQTTSATVEKLWSKTTTELGATVNDTRQGIGRDGVVYLLNKANQSLVAVSAERQDTLCVGPLDVAEGVTASLDGTACTLDDAGNFVIEGTFPNIPSHLVLRKADGSIVKDFAIKGLARTDYITATGDVFSAEGGHVFLYGNNANLLIYKVAEGVLVGDPIEVVGVTNGNNNNVISGDDKTQIIHHRTSQAGWMQVENGSESLIEGMEGFKNTTMGGDIITLAGKEFYIYPTGTTNYNSEFCVRNMTDGVFVVDKADGSTTSFTPNSTEAVSSTITACWLSASKIDDNNAYIHVFNSQGVAVYKLSVSTPVDTPVDTPSDSYVIKYTSSDGNIVTPNYASSYVFGVNIVSNTYSNGQGVITFDGPVTSIGESAFEDCSRLTSVTIPNSVTSIRNWAFYGCSKLTSVTINSDAIVSKDYSYLSSIFGSQVTEYIIGESVTSIGEEAFRNCSSLTSVTIGESVTSIGYRAFEDCSKLTSVTIGNSVTSIGKDAFYGCSSLTKTNYTGDIAGWCNIKFGNYSANPMCYSQNFYINDQEIKDLVIPNSVTSIGEEAFFSCSSLTSVTIPNSVTSIGKDAFYGCSSLTSITIPNSVTSIGSYAFKYCSSLTSVIIPNSVTSIGEDAFYGCSSLTSVIIPNSVTSIGEDAFYGCSSLTSVTINSDAIVSKDYSCSSIFGSQVTEYIIGESVTSIGSSAFRNCSSLTSVTIGESVTSIGYRAFEGCSSLTSVTIPESVTSIGSSAFNSCSALTSVTIPNSVKSIGGDAFAYCSSLRSVTIGESVTSIGSFAFRNCSSLTYVTIGESVTSIGVGAFYKCTFLTSITCEAETPPTVDSGAFSYVSTSIPIYVPCGCVSAYKWAYEWDIFTNIQEPLAEYSIEVNVNDNIMGSAKVDKNTACGNQISATANYGYHFVHWSDGNTDNPRSLVLTQDTTLTAEFALNTYTISTQCNYTERGTTSGDITTTYLDYVTISATANYGYHFSHWNDYNYDNPRQVQVTGDKTYTATFDKNTYAISLSCNEEQGSVEGVTSAEYLDTVTISATPNIGYHFVQWSDGITDNPRTLELTQDTTFSAEFAQSFSGQCGDNLYWSYDETAKTISITGSGKMYDYTADTQPWLLFKEQIVEVTTTNTVTSIGTSAFEGCARLGKISLGTGLEEIAAHAFAGCTRLYDIYVYAAYPPFADESSFANYNVYVYIPCEYQRDYTLDVVWGKFKFIECIDSEEATTDGNVTIVPGYNDVTITWPTEDNADNYAIVIEKDGEVFCTLTFNADGQLLNIAFAPARNGDNRPVQYAEQAVGGYRFTVTGLTEATRYAYNVTTKDAANKTIATYSGEFTTKGGITTAVEDILHSTTNCQKLLRDGQLLIIRDGKTYTIMGAEIK